MTQEMIRQVYQMNAEIQDGSMEGKPRIHLFSTQDNQNWRCE